MLLLGWSILFSCSKETPRFERLAATQTGIHFTNEIVETDSFNILQNEYMYNGGGTGIADLNNDGLADVVLVGNKVSSRIFLNKGGLKFQDITANFEDMTNRQWLSGVAVTDINADGWIDLYFTSTMSDDSLQRKNRLWVNQGLDSDGLPHFKEMAEQYGIADMGHSMHAAFFDYDLDGDLDLYILNNYVGEAVPTNYRPKITDGSSANNDRLYQNLGNGRFADVTKDAGIVYEGFGLGLAIGDVNKDGYPDIFVSNDYIANDLLYINQGDGTFRNEATTYLTYSSKFSMGNDMADINQDGYLDIMTLDMMPEQYFRKKQTINGNSYFFYVNDDKYGYQHQYVRNMVQLHNGFLNGEMLPFSEVGQMMGVYQTEWSWSALFADYDNDGDRDLLVTNGFPKDLTDKDFTNYKASVYGHLASDKDILPKIPVVKVSNYAFENTGDFRFANHTKEWGMDIPSFSNGAAFVDLDNDGDLDYVVNNINDEAFVYRNNTIEKSKSEAPDYLRLRLIGRGPNTLAIGARVELWNDGQLHYDEHFLSRGYLSSVDPVIHFGLGSSDLIDSIRVVWPTGTRITLLSDVQPNQLLELKEDDASPYEFRSVAAGEGDLLFSRIDAGLAYRHTQLDFIDFFQTQRIIPHKLSQIGPCMARGDIDGDGRDDLLIGASDQMPTTVFLHKGDGFAAAEFPGLTDSRQCTESDLVITDVDSDGDNDVVALSGGYLNQQENEYQHFAYLNEGAVFRKVALPLPPFPASVVRALDYDHDGDTDFFVGARVKKDAYPYAEKSYLVVNDNGKFSTGSAASFDLGMVTDAVWSDYDGDGWEDLLVAREWNSLAVLKNQQGHGLEAIIVQELDDKRGLWSAIAAGDLDGDGDDDIIAGNLGENHRFIVDDQHPMRLYGIDLDNNGAIDPFTTAYWRDKDGQMQEYPVNYLDELAAQSPFFRKMFTSYTQFSFTTVDSIFDRSKVPADQIFQVNTTSSYILWNDGGKFTWERLPDALQTAPLRELMVRDFNGDRKMDILAAGNDYTYDVSTGYYDANKGVLLLGKGNRRFELLPTAKSGILLRGQVESLLFFEGDYPLLVAGINRDSILVYQQQLQRPVN